MQRIVKWTEGGYNPKPPYLGGAGKNGYVNDLDGGAVFALDLTPEALQVHHPDLLRALSHRGRLGRIVSHSWTSSSSYRRWTFVVEF